MRGVVPDQFERALILARDELDRGVLVDRVGEIGERAVDNDRDGALGERRRDRLRDVEAGDFVGILPTRAIGKGQSDHAHSCCSLAAYERR